MRIYKNNFLITDLENIFFIYESYKKNYIEFDINSFADISIHMYKYIILYMYGAKCIICCFKD